MRDLFLKNFGWKMLSVALAVAIWLTVKTMSVERGNQTDRAFINVPVQLVSGTTDVRAFKIEPEFVSVTVKGRPESLKILAEREIRVFADITSTDTAQNFRRNLDVALPNGIALANVQPSEVQVIVPPKSKIIISTRQ